jgi:hypothetical protein
MPACVIDQPDLMATPDSKKRRQSQLALERIGMGAEMLSMMRTERRDAYRAGPSAVFQRSERVGTNSEISFSSALSEFCQFRLNLETLVAPLGDCSGSLCFHIPQNKSGIL